MRVLLWWLILVALSAGSGALIHLAFRRFADPAKLREVKRRKRAWLYELRLYVDEPSLIWRAQVALLKDTFRHVALLSKPLLVLAPPMLLVYVVLDHLYSGAPLAPGRTATLTVRLTPPFPHAAPQLRVPSGIAVETPPVRIPSTSEVSWRIRPTREVAGMMRIHLGGEMVERGIRAGPGFGFPLPERRRGRQIQSVEIDYPDAGLGWLLWFTGISLGTFLLLNRRPLF